MSWPLWTEEWVHDKDWMWSWLWTTCGLDALEKRSLLLFQQIEAKFLACSHFADCSIFIPYILPHHGHISARLHGVTSLKSEIFILKSQFLFPFTLYNCPIIWSSLIYYWHYKQTADRFNWDKFAASHHRISVSVWAKKTATYPHFAWHTRCGVILLYLFCLFVFFFFFGKFKRENKVLDVNTSV